ncbi:DUF3493 domain-containing protein [Tumidithrix elongata RA019]|uniref:DUF3493 domain-containing protein n=1 Tax=Tumidithrix elongata BACA0141 TaxID=2716417 RepID=A0AAW9Q250_9CYAN|nr:DUF3493 domain-containing protein [Tumidithrix elongata RA019]
MPNSSPDPINLKPLGKSSQRFTSKQYAKLKAEATSPYRGLRKFIYATCGASGAIGAFVFFAQLLAGRGEFETTLGNLALQIGIVALMVGLFRLERKD